MNRNIPGYYFDEEKKKYFRIQPNHVAPPASEYSKEAVANKRVTQKIESQKKAVQLRGGQECLEKSRLRQHPLLDFGRRLGVYRHPVTRDIAEYYCAGMTGRVIWGPGNIGACRNGSWPWRPVTKFDVDKGTGNLISAAPARVPLNEDFETHWSEVYNGQVLVLPRIHGRSIQNRVPDGILVVNSRYTVLADGNPLGSVLTITSLEDTGSGAFILEVPSEVRDIAASPKDDRWALATSDGLMISSGSSMHDLLLHHPRSLRSKEQMALSFKDTNTIMSGTRTGRVSFTDLRVDSCVVRLRHTSAVNAIRALRNNNQILVSGLSTMNIYDLRFAKAPEMLRSRTATLTEPFMAVHIPADRTSDRYGLGFDYDPELGIVAAASSNNQAHHVSLYSTYTGRMIQGSALNENPPASSITCIKIARVRGGPKSIFTAVAGRIEEWTPQGVGYSYKDQE